MPDAGASYCQIVVGRTMAGVIGLQEMLAALYQEGVVPGAPELGQRLVTEFRKHNYVPPNATRIFEEALLREYQRYLQAQQSGQTGRLWRDPRKEQKPWYPTLFEEKCNGCGACLPACPHNVLGWNGDKSKVLVLEPYECAPGCELCAKACAPQAIIMPPRAILHQRTDTSGNRF